MENNINKMFSINLLNEIIDNYTDRLFLEDDEDVNDNTINAKTLENIKGGYLKKSLFLQYRFLTSTELYFILKTLTRNIRDIIAPISKDPNELTNYWEQEKHIKSQRGNLILLLSTYNKANTPVDISAPFFINDQNKKYFYDYAYDVFEEQLVLMSHLNILMSCVRKHLPESHLWQKDDKYTIVKYEKCGQPVVSRSAFIIEVPMTHKIPLDDPSKVGLIISNNTNKMKQVAALLPANIDQYIIARNTYQKHNPKNLPSKDIKDQIIRIEEMMDINITDQAMQTNITLNNVSLKWATYYSVVDDVRESEKDIKEMASYIIEDILNYILSNLINT
jgi:hypothetical protein